MNKVVEVEVEGICCNHCIQKIKKSLEGLPGIKNIDINEKGEGKIEFEEEKASVDAIVRAVEGAGHYKVKSTKLAR